MSGYRWQLFQLSRMRISSLAIVWARDGDESLTNL